MATVDNNEDNQQEAEVSALEHVRKETTPSQPNQSLSTPQSRLRDTLLNRSYSAPKCFDPSASSLDVPSSSSASTILPARGKKRDSNGEIKQMIAELNARTELAMSREETATPEGWKFDRGLPFPRNWGDDCDWGFLTKYPSIMSCSPRSLRTPRSTSSTDGGSKDVGEENRQEGNPRKHKRQGSLLEWRNKEMFEEPVRI